MRRTYPLCRLTPEAAGKLQHDNQRLTHRLDQAKRYAAALHQEIRAAHGTEALWALQHAARNAITLQQLQEELSA